MLGLALSLGVGMVGVRPAAANHKVTWGAGTDCAAVSSQATTGVNVPVRMVACVRLDGAPLPGWRLTLVVKGPARTVESEITTDAAGNVGFSVQPTVPGQTTVTLCDDDGCLYGETVITVTEATTTTVPATTVPPTTVPSTAATGTTVTTRRAASDGASDGDGGGGTPAWAWGALVFLLVLLAAAQRGMLVMPVGDGVAADPCARYREAVRRRQQEREEAERRRQQAQARAEAAKDALTRMRSTQGVGSLDDLETDVLLAEADAEAATEAGIRAADALQFARNDLARCERGDVMVAPEPAGGPAPGSTPPPAPAPVPCCGGRVWIGVNMSCGGQAVVVGREGGMVFLYCADNPDRSAIITWQGTRWGPGLGGGAAAALFIVVDGPEHPNELEPVVKRILEGVDWDLSLGGSLSKIGRAGVTAVRHRRTLDMLRRLWTYANRCRDLKKARRAGNGAEILELQRQFGSVIREFGGTGVAREMADKLAEAGAKGATSGAQSGGSGVNIPLGVGVQVGVWNLAGVKTELFDVDGCPQCDPSAGQ